MMKVVGDRRKEMRPLLYLLLYENSISVENSIYNRHDKNLYIYEMHT